MRLYYSTTFDAAHWLPGYVGSCNALHGHTWKVEITVEGDKKGTDHMIVDFRALKIVIDAFDHTCLNATVCDNPTCENLVSIILGRIREHLLLEQKCFRTITVRLWESEHSYCEDSCVNL